MTDKEKIRAEVEMRLSHHLAFSGKFKGFKSMADEDKAILSFIDSLPEELTKFDIGDTIRPKGSKAEYTITSISGGCYHGNGWGLPIGAEKDYELVESAEDVDACNIQYASIDGAIKAHAEDYSFNIDSELFQQLTPEQQKLWRKEIEQACISGGYSGLNLAKDPRYKENLEVKEIGVDVGSPEGDLGRETVQFIDADGNISYVIINKAQKEEL